MMKNFEVSLVYGIGKKAKTKEYSFSSSDILKPLVRQISLSIPLITSITLKTKQQEELYSIYVGKEFHLNCFDEYYIEKYDLNVEELERFRDAGYERVCLLNYKKYDPVIIGLKKEDKVVPDYYALKSNMTKLLQLF